MRPLRSWRVPRGAWGSCSKMISAWRFSAHRTILRFDFSVSSGSVS